MNEKSSFVSESFELSSEEHGGKIIFATDDFFAVAENLLKREEPIWNEEYTEFGKWMDGWETRRKRTAGHDWTIISLAWPPSPISGVCVDTAFFTGNYALRFSLQGARLSPCSGLKEIQNRSNKIGTAASDEDLKRVAELHSEDWETLLPMTELKSGCPDTRKHYFKLDTDGRVFTHLRFNIYPDGGVARLRVYGNPMKSHNSETREPVRGKCVEFSDAHYGHPDNLLKPWPSEGMHDGWETARRLDRPPTIDLDRSGFVKVDGEEWAILKLEKSIFVDCIEVDTTHFKGNCPDSVKIEGALVETDEHDNSFLWSTILNRTKLLANQSNGLKHPFVPFPERPINHVKVIIAPDGGIARIRIYGRDCIVY